MVAETQRLKGFLYLTRFLLSLRHTLFAYRLSHELGDAMAMAANLVTEAVLRISPIPTRLPQVAIL